MVVRLDDKRTVLDVMEKGGEDGKGTDKIVKTIMANINVFDEPTMKLPSLKGKITKTYHHLLKCSDSLLEHFSGTLVDKISTYLKYYNDHEKERFLNNISEVDLQKIEVLVGTPGDNEKTGSYDATIIKINVLLAEGKRDDAIEVYDVLIKRIETVIAILHSMFDVENVGGNIVGDSEKNFIHSFEGISDDFKKSPVMRNNNDTEIQKTNGEVVIQTSKNILDNNIADTPK